MVLDPRLPLVHSSGLKSSPVGTLGKKYVDLGGMFTPAAAICSHLLDGGRAQEEGGVVLAGEHELAAPRRPCGVAQAAQVARCRPRVRPSGPLRTSASSTAVSSRR